MSKIAPTKRGRSAVVAVALAAAVSGWFTFSDNSAPDTPAEVRAAIAEGYTPPAVELAIDKLIKPWEGVSLKAYRDIVGVVTICYGETKGVKMGMHKTLAECDAMLKTRVTNDYYLQLVSRVIGFTEAPVSLQASMTSLAYNVGVSGASRSTAARYLTAGNYRGACEAATAWNRAGGKVVRGLVLRREMGDKQRLGEAEICVSGL